jgi:DNA replication licensing factor MCM2
LILFVSFASSVSPLLCAENRESLEISYLHLISYVSRLAVWLAEAPQQMLDILDAQATAVVRALYPNYHQIHAMIHVRVQDLPISDPLRDLRYESFHLRILPSQDVCHYQVRKADFFFFDSCFHFTPITSQVHLNALIKTSGVVTRRTNVLPQLSLVKYNCVKCGFLLGPFLQSGDKEVTPGSCPECQSKGPFSVNQEQV